MSVLIHVHKSDKSTQNHPIVVNGLDMRDQAGISD